MRSTNESFKKERKKVKKDYNHIFLLIQIVLLIAIILFSFISLTVDEFTQVVYGLVSILMFIMAYNNVNTYKRKFATYIYIFMGVLLLTKTVIMIFN